MFRVRFLLALLSIHMLLCANSFSRNTTAHSSHLPVEGKPPVSAALGRDLSVYYVQTTQNGLRLENSRHSLKASFNSGGTELRVEGNQWHLQLLGFGRGDTFEKADRVAPRSSRNRVEYARATSTEWYVNGPAGLEQGFTIRQRPPRLDEEPLTVALQFSGELTREGAGDLVLMASGGKAALRYTGLGAWDAAGRELRAWQEFQEGRLLLKVDDRAAAYPVTIDPWIERARLIASDRQSDDLFGQSVAIDGDTVVVGAPASGNAAQGAAYVFVKPASGWKNMTQVAKLTATDATFEDELGFAVDVQGDTIVVGAPVLGFNNKPGAVYVFVKPVGGWKDMTQTAELVPSDPQNSWELGWFVALSGNTVFGGATGGAGNIYVYTRPSGGWKKHMTETAKLTVSRGGGVAGWLSVDHDTVVAGGNTSSGKYVAFVYLKPAKGWKKTMTETATLEASDGQAQDEFGFSTYVEGDTIVVGAPEANVGSNFEQGAGYVFAKPAGGWKGLLMQTAKLTASDGQARDQLGFSATISGTTVLLDASEAHLQGQNIGKVYGYIRPKSGWKNTTQNFKIIEKNGADAISTSGSTMVIGSGAIIHGRPQGAAYVFENVK